MKAARLVSAPWLALLALSAGCSNSTGPVAGTLDVSLSSPQQDDGAVLLSITGGPVDSVESRYTVYSASVSADTLKLILIGSLVSGSIARIHISDSRQALRYIARIGQVAARGTYGQRDPTRYAVRLQP